MYVQLPASTQACNPNGPEPANTNDDQGHPEGIITFDTAIIPFSGRAVPTTVVPSFVPLHARAGPVSLLVYPAIFLVDFPS